jgi:phage recombination protein Bet
MSTTLVAQPAVPADKAIEYVPFGSRDKIKLTLDMVRSFLCPKTKSGAVASDVQIVKFMMLCKSRQLNPWEGDAFLVGYDSQKDGPVFSLITAHQAFLKRAEVNEEYDGMESGVIVRDAQGELRDRNGDFMLDDDFLLGGWATVYFKRRSHPMSKRLEFKKFRKDNKFWNDNPAGQIVKCAEADALRSSFPTTIGGLYVQDEVLAVDVADNPVLPPAGRQSLRSPKPNGKTPEPASDPTPAPTSEATSAASAPSGETQGDADDSQEWPKESVTVPESSQLSEAEQLELMDGLRRQIEEVTTKKGCAVIEGELERAKEQLRGAYDGLKNLLAAKRKTLPK